MVNQFKPLSEEQRHIVETEIKLMIVAHRDCLWNRYNGDDTGNEPDPNKISLSCKDGYYGEAFGIIRGLSCLGYGYIGADNVPHHSTYHEVSAEPWRNLKWWFNQLCKEVLKEEGYPDCLGFEIKALLEYYRKEANRLKPPRERYYA